MIPHVCWEMLRPLSGGTGVWDFQNSPSWILVQFLYRCRDAPMNGILLLPENIAKSMWSKYAQTQDCPSQLGVSFLVGFQFQWIITTFPISMAIWPFGYTPSDIANSCPGVLKLLYSVLPPDITRHGAAATVNRAIWRWNVCQRHLHDSRYV